MTFALAIEYVLMEEGGYANDPSDPGGETNWGISKRVYPWLDIRMLTRDEAVRIYMKDYWRAADCDAVPALARLAYFDAAVNCGVKTAVRWAQLVAGARSDGVVGPVTREVWAQADGGQLLEDFHNMRLQHHARIARDRPASLKFLPGWVIRCVRVRLHCLEPR